MFLDKFRKKGKKPEMPRGTTTNIQFQNVKHPSDTVRTSESEIPADCWDTIERCIDDMLDGNVEFVILTLGEIRSNIRYVQACPEGESVYLELGIEEGGHTRLVNKTCPPDECFAVFEEFFTSKAVSGLSGYTPSEFFV